MGYRVSKRTFKIYDNLHDFYIYFYLELHQNSGWDFARVKLGFKHLPTPASAPHTHTSLPTYRSPVAVRLFVRLWFSCVAFVLALFVPHLCFWCLAILAFPVYFHMFLTLKKKMFHDNRPHQHSQCFDYDTYRRLSHLSIFMEGAGKSVTI